MYKIGSIPIVLSAPHAVKQCRNHKIKANDYLTGALAIYLANKCDCSYFVRTFNDNDDPNYPVGITLSQVDSEYLKVLKRIVQDYGQMLVIDIHGCTDCKKSDCSLWHDNYLTCDPYIINVFEKNISDCGLTIDDGSEYAGGQVTRQCAMITNSFQLEIKRKIRSLEIEKLYLLESFIKAMQKSILDTNHYFMKLKKNSGDQNG